MFTVNPEMISKLKNELSQRKAAMETAKDLRGAKSCRGTVRKGVSLDIPK